MTSLTAHPYVVLAETQWRREQLGGANLAPRRHGGVRWHLPRAWSRGAHRTPHPV